MPTTLLGHLMTLEIERSILRDKIEQLVGALGLPDSKAFLSMVFGLTTGAGYDTLEDDDFTDGGDDFEVDVLNLDDSSDPNTAIATVFARSINTTHIPTDH